MSDSTDSTSNQSRDQVEARLVAMLLGEASAFDEEQLREQLKKDESLAQFYSEIEQTLPLLKEALEVEGKPSASRMQLAGKRRKELKRTFQGERRLAKRKISRPEFRRTLAIAAAVVALLLMASVLLLPSLRSIGPSAQVDRLALGDFEGNEETTFASPGKKGASKSKPSDDTRAYDTSVTRGDSDREKSRLVLGEPAAMPGEPPSGGMAPVADVAGALKDLDWKSEGGDQAISEEQAESEQALLAATERVRGEADYDEAGAVALGGDAVAKYHEKLGDNRRFADLAMPESAEEAPAGNITVATGMFNTMDPASHSGNGAALGQPAVLESLAATLDQAESPAAEQQPANEFREQSANYYKQLASPPAPGTPAPSASQFARDGLAVDGREGFKSRISNGKQQSVEWGIQTQNSVSPEKDSVVMGGIGGLGTATGGSGAMGGGGGFAGYGGMVPPTSGPATLNPTETFADNYDVAQGGEKATFGRHAEVADDDSSGNQPGVYGYAGRQTVTAGKNVAFGGFGFANAEEGKSAATPALGQAQQGQGRGQVLGGNVSNWAKGKEGDVMMFDVDGTSDSLRSSQSARSRNPQRSQAPAARRGFFSNGVLVAAGGAELKPAEEGEAGLAEFETESLERLAKQSEDLVLKEMEELEELDELQDEQTAAAADRGRSSVSVPGQKRIERYESAYRISGKLNAPAPSRKPRPKVAPKPAPEPSPKQELARGGRVLQLAQQQAAEKESLLEENRRDFNRPISKLDADKKKLAATAKGLKKEPPPPAEAEKPAVVYTPKPETVTSENAFSTFSLNVSDVSFKTTMASLQSNKLPETNDVRSEEFLNALEYRDPMPRAGESVAFNWERARSPFTHDRDIIRFSVKTAALGRQPGRAVNLVCLLDNSGSMEREDRVSIVTQALGVLARKLTPNDRVSLITFSRTPQLRIDGMRGGQGAAFLRASTGWNPQGGTHVENGLALAYATAKKHFVKGGNNRVILLTDGAANMGNVNPYKLREKVEANRKQGIALDCFGIGWEGYNDNLLEVLARNGDGRYGFLNQPSHAVEEFEKKLLGAFQVAASDVKVQVEWNEKRVKVYRQVGYLRHQLKKEDFRNNKVDAAEISAAESGNAMYVVQVDKEGEGPLGMVRVRYKKPFTSEYTELEWSLAYEEAVLPLEQSSPAMKLASVSATFAEWLARNPYSEGVQLADLQGLMAGLPSVYGTDPRPAQLEEMIRKARILAGN